MHEKKGGLRIAKARGEEQRMENQARERREASMRRPSSVGVYNTKMPVLPGSLPRGVRIIDARGGHAVALACCGVFLGLYLRSAI